ncbi:hypothetical protein FHW36_1011330 [Chitinophaga polysaccharea]|uniref:Outer membrane lipoprotein-sorting protein n=1 Tax=Chitinophaga polysaccharea TaxID=1293035 RepID=A0A561Q4V5_9BACT|nr:hypothetical protein [Chitinophaga polysaccharea]TWF45400.1 hypothetical protein FHW36_1011330 [Chitinophaga polysaccharea]
MNRLKWILCCICLLVASFQGKGQTVENLDKAMDILSKAGAVYSKGQLSFDIRYTYANEEQPTVITDSLSGSIRMAGGNCFSVLQNSVVLKNARYNIALFKEDKLMYVTKPAPKDSLNASPMAMIGAMVKQAGIKTCNITDKKDTTTIRFGFGAAAPYRFMEIKLDSKTSRVHQLQFAIQRALLPGAPSAADADSTSYAMVKGVFSHYSTADIDAGLFDEKQFFTRKADKLLPSAAYEDYEVFIGSPNL